MLSAVIILLVADVLWHAIKTAIDRKLAEAADLGQPNTDEARRQARLRTLLPIFRNILFVVVIAVAVMMALAALGVQIGPLIAGAGVVGVAVGFGAQTFVRDVIAGMFYLLDDAFRVGEYIQSGNYKGTVEGFSIRSVRLRHHRGPVYTVPFSLLGAVQNQSRDWVIDKIAIGVTYDSDLDLAKKADQADRAGLAEGPRIRAADPRAVKDAGGRQPRRFRGPDPGEDDDPAGRAVRHPAPGLCDDQKGLRRERHQIRLPDRAGRRRRRTFDRRRRPTRVQLELTRPRRRQSKTGSSGRCRPRSYP